MIEVRIPSLGESITEGVIVRWAKNEGEVVKPDDILLELETDKASTEIPSERAGVLHILKKEGDTVQVGDLVAQIDEQGTASAPAPTPASSVAATPPVAAPAPAVAAPPALVAAPPPPAPTEPTASAARPVGPLSPSVRNLIEEHGLDPAAIPASGKGGRLTKGDVLVHIERRASGAPTAPTPPMPMPVAAKIAPAPAAPAVPTAPRPARDGEERIAMGRIRKRIAERLVAAQQTAAILTTFNEVDMTAVMGLRSQYKDRFAKAHGVGLGFMSFFGRACVAALEELPVVNAEIDGEDVVYKHYVNLGVAVGTERGLVVPVVKHAEQMGFADLEREIGRLAGLARDGKLTLDHLQGGTFTISNGGVYGSLLSTPILTPPQVAILGMHKIEKRPVVIDDQIVIRPMMYLALSYDHRLVDGEQAVTFLVRVKERLEDPSRLLLDV
ncbi:MAG TPA: 2-oxoglutarate dehydrogenase complex dihydrolipoyllysine-residue succinyltransferase [Candidatus Binatia bacterium]|jgi:2-oxoglutarate dehydrogenase E2 component (dihydrolipoamide succinyltransferase)|nr:2-oxoglutarate dehydrogenase complex dihydrolipoyllysine-residue succinyltransferase [Candidatus Binatia bacterium]